MRWSSILSETPRPARRVPMFIVRDKIKIDHEIVDSLLPFRFGHTMVHVGGCIPGHALLQGLGWLGRLPPPPKTAQHPDPWSSSAWRLAVLGIK
jgi:hypothetical protein